MKNYKIILLSFFALFVLLFSANGNISDAVIFPSKENPVRNLALQNAIITTDPADKEAFSVRDLTYRGISNPMITDLLLSFNDKSFLLKRDDSGKYIIRNAEYRFVRNSGALGGGAAGFYNKDHNIEIETSKNLWLGSCSDSGSFTIEFRVYPVSFINEGVLFTRVGYFSGKKNGIEIKIKDRRIVVEFFRLFKDSNNVRHDVKLLKGKELELNKWHHFILSFDRISGKLAKFLNGFEEDIVYVTENYRPYEDVFEPSFECTDMPAAVIGKNFYGCMDEFRLSYRHIDDLKKENDLADINYKKLELAGRQPLNNQGIITSPVHTLPSTGTSVTLFKWSELLKEHTFIWMEFRISDSLFGRNDEALKWYRVANNQKSIYLMKDSGNYLRGKYCQWRAYLVPSPDGKYSPYLYNVELNYQPDTPPSVPQFLEVVNAGNKDVTLRWNKNVEHDISGYRIYYGIVPGRYDGIISYINGKKITNDLNSNRKYIEVKISNDVIEENRQRDSIGVLDYPLMDNTVLYFFSVSAYDTYKPDTPHNHESPLSGAVKARPFAGSEIKM
ncbi:MAG: LamG-like jellyroll fold domain-containing protein [Spirochaetota bacterium]